MTNGMIDIFFSLTANKTNLTAASGGGSPESQYLSKSTNNQINIYFSKSRSNTMTTILK